MALTDVAVQALPLERLEALLGPVQAEELRVAAGLARSLFEGRVVWNVNSTASGGGVAEMLRPLVGYTRGAGVDGRWAVIGGDTDFFRVTKRLHNRLHGAAGDGGPLGAAESEHYRRVTAHHGAELAALVRPDDVVILHDPQTAGMIASLRATGAAVVWRCHVGSDHHDELVTSGWEFLRPAIEGASAYVFSRPLYPPRWLRDRVKVIAPSIDPFSAKNQDMDPAVVRAILGHIGVIAAFPGARVPAFTRRDDTPGRVDHVADIVRTGAAPPADAPLVVQVSRWDHLKDMAGVMQGFADSAPRHAHLALVGPDVSQVADDPEGAQVLGECVDQLHGLPPAVRDRIALVALPMSDDEENAAMVNAVQRHAAVVVQKSLAEGFGLTVAEAMWKGRPVVASAVGGIPDQLTDGRHGVLLEDPHDLPALGAALDRLLGDPSEAARLGRAARERVTEHFLNSRSLVQYVRLIEGLGV